VILLFIGGDSLFLDRGDEIELLDRGVNAKALKSTLSSSWSEEAGEEDGTILRFWRFAGGAITAARKLHLPTSG
jgi:hypothetical protein